jgi:hypothetical protein
VLLLHDGLLPEQLLQPAVLPVDVNVELLPQLLHVGVHGDTMRLQGTQLAV